MEKIGKKELLEQISQETEKLYRMQPQHKITPLRNTSLLGKSKRQIARLKTFLSAIKEN